MKSDSKLYVFYILMHILPLFILENKLIIQTDHHLMGPFKKLAHHMKIRIKKSQAFTHYRLIFQLNFYILRIIIQYRRLYFFIFIQ